MRLHCIGATTIVFAFAAVSSLAVEVLDQQNDVSPSATADSAFPFSQEVGQTFTVGVAGTLKRIEVQLNRFNNLGGSAILTVYNTAGGVPNASLGTASLSTSSIPSGGFAFLPFDVSSSSIAVSVGQVMAFGIKSSGESGYFLRSTFNISTYAGGESKWRSLGPPLGAWQSFSPSHDSGFQTIVEAAAGLPGDYNSDTKVDAADYVKWRNYLGAPNEAPIHGNGDGLNGVDPNDFTRWRSHFAPAAGAWTAAVPEPFAATLLAWAGLMSALTAPRRRFSDPVPPSSHV